MTDENLFRKIAHVLATNERHSSLWRDGWLLFQTQVDDVARESRRIALLSGLELDQCSLTKTRKHENDGKGTKRRQRVEEVREDVMTSWSECTNAGWISLNPLVLVSEEWHCKKECYASSETEAALELEKRSIFRFLARPPRKSVLKVETK